MDETSGTTMHDAVGSHTGTLHSVALGQPGFLGTAFGFNGSSSYVSVPTQADLNPGSADITVTIHLKTTSAPATPDWDIIRKGHYTTSGGECKMEYQPSGQASCGFKGSSGYSELIAGPVDQGRPVAHRPVREDRIGDQGRRRRADVLEVREHRLDRQHRRRC